MNRTAVEVTIDEIRAAIARKQNRLAQNPLDPRLASRLAYDQRMLAAGEHVLALLSECNPPRLADTTADDREFIRINNL